MSMQSSSYLVFWPQNNNNYCLKIIPEHATDVVVYHTRTRNAFLAPYVIALRSTMVDCIILLLSHMLLQ